MFFAHKTVRGVDETADNKVGRFAAATGRRRVGNASRATSEGGPGVLTSNFVNRHSRATTIGAKHEHRDSHPLWLADAR